MPVKKYIECGRIINTHGVAGGLKLESWCNIPEDLAELKRVFIPDAAGILKETKIVKASVLGKFVVAWFDGVSDIDAALPLKSKTVFAMREDFLLDESEYFIADLAGLEVVDKNSGKVYGKLKEIINRGSSDIYVIDTEQGERMIPAVPEFIAEIDIDRGIFVTPIDGMFEDVLQ